MKSAVLLLALVGLAAYAGAVPVKYESAPESDALTLDDLDAVLGALESMNAASGVTTYGLGKKIRKGIKKIGRAIEKGAKKALEHGASFNISIFAKVEHQNDDGDDTTVSFEELGQFVEAIELIDAKSEQVMMYGLGKKIRKGLKKIGKAIEKAGKAALEKGISIPIPIPISIPLSLNNKHPNEEVTMTHGFGSGL